MRSTVMTDGQSFSLIPERTLAEQYFENLHTAYRSMREVFKLRAAQGMTQDDLADRLDSDKGLISRRLNGQENMTLKTLSAMASGLDCGLNIQFIPFEEYRSPSNYFESDDSDVTNKQPRGSGTPTIYYMGGP